MILGVQQQLQALARLHPPQSPQAKQSLEWNLELIQHTVEEARRVMGGLRPTALDDFGLASALRLQIDALRSEGWEIPTKRLFGTNACRPHETALYCISQKALTNVRKHADTTHARVNLGAWDRKSACVSGIGERASSRGRRRSAPALESGSVYPGWRRG